MQFQRLLTQVTKITAPSSPSGKTILAVCMAFSKTFGNSIPTRVPSHGNMDSREWNAALTGTDWELSFTRTSGCWERPHESLTIHELCVGDVLEPQTASSGEIYGVAVTNPIGPCLVLYSGTYAPKQELPQI